MTVTTGELNIVEDSYHFGNQGNTIEAVAGTQGMVVIGDYIYTSGGGFWASTRLLEFKKRRKTKQPASFQTSKENSPVVYVRQENVKS